MYIRGDLLVLPVGDWWGWNLRHLIATPSKQQQLIQMWHVCTVQSSHWLGYRLTLKTVHRCFNFELLN